jgi:hypothetical protein
VAYKLDSLDLSAKNTQHHRGRKKFVEALGTTLMNRSLEFREIVGCSRRCPARLSSILDERPLGGSKYGVFVGGEQHRYVHHPEMISRFIVVRGLNTEVIVRCSLESRTWFAGQ